MTKIREIIICKDTHHALFTMKIKNYLGLYNGKVVK